MTKSLRITYNDGTPADILTYEEVRERLGLDDTDPELTEVDYADCAYDYAHEVIDFDEADYEWELVED